VGDFYGESWLAARVMLLVPVLLSLSVHEFAHAWAAHKLGDDTAAQLGRLTVNPIAHIDPVGLLLPLLGVPFGWAKPVPINIARFYPNVNVRTGVMLTAAAGPLSNLLLAFAATLVLALLARLGAAAEGGAVAELIGTLVFINLVLALFNLLPVPPLDGSRIVDGLCPEALRPAWNAFSRLGPLALILVLVAPLFLGFSLIGAPLYHAQALLDSLFTTLAR